MKGFERFVSKLSRLLDNIAGWGIVLVMVMVVINIILRRVFNSPILGIYDFVSYITSVIIGFGLAWCALQKAHIAIEFIVDKFSEKSKSVIEVITGFCSVILLLFAGYQMVLDGFKVIKNGEVSATAQIPFYPFIFMVAFGLLVLCLVECVNVLKEVTKK
jgi:TRAP-type C4-dicarboxylate transport system permease small subunit